MPSINNSYFSTVDSSVPFNCLVMSDSLWPHGLCNARLSCPSPTPGTCSNSCPSSRWRHPTSSSSVVHFSSCLQSFPASGVFPMSQFFISGGQSTGASVSASVFPMNIQDCFPLGLTSLISLQSKGLSSIFSSMIQKAQFFASGGPSIGASASASVLPMNIQDCFPLGWTGWISLQSKGLSRVFSNTTVQKHQFFSDTGDLGSISGSGRSLGEGNGYPLQYSCLENSMDRGAWWATVHGVTKNQTWLSD